MNSLNKKNGFVLPMVVVFLLIFMLIALLLVSRFGGSDREEFVKSKERNENYFPALAGADHAKFNLLRPDDPSEKHIWEVDRPPETYELDINGKKVTVTIEDVEEPK